MNEPPNSDKSSAVVPSSGSGDMALIGEGTPNETRVSFQVLQSIYHELTGKTEEISRYYGDPFKVTLPELQDLDHKLHQCCEQFNVKAETTEIRVYYLNDTQQRFSSFDRFSLLHAGSSSCVESVLLKYNFLIFLPKTNQPQSYTVSVRVASRIALEKKMSEDNYNIPKLFRMMGGDRTVAANVEYIDYMVARTFLELVDDWSKSIPRSHDPKIMRYLRKHSHTIPRITRYFVGAFVAYLILRAIPAILEPASSPATLATFFFASFFGLFAAFELARLLGGAAERAIDNWSALSYVQLTGADKQLIDTASRANKWTIARAVLNIVGSILVAVFAKIIANILTAP
ncbi:MAG TPA: hypothetical protein VGR65_04690 [Casimicrobiaceae bacterium]|jgi:hypothetical protein|nr:hypothetical protein [Casimicrobiaceae bacterium]